MSDEPKTSASPKWSSTAKLVVALTIAGLGAALIFRFQNILAPLLLSFILAYLFHPIALYFNRRLKIPWRLISTIIFILIFAAVIGLFTWGGISIFDQVQNLINYLQRVVGDFPTFIESMTAEPLMIGPWEIDLSSYQASDLTTQFQGVINSALSQIGTLLGSIASGIGSTITWTVFILIIAYFIMSESDGVRAGMIKLSLPKYQEDITRLGSQLSHIWNAFLRGQLIIFVITVAWYSLLLSVLGVRYFFLLAILAGLARFVPYVGPAVAWTTYGLVALFQTNYFNLMPFPYALIVVGSAWVSDMVMDSIVSPRILSNALKIHPAAVLVMVFISASLFGFIGVLLSAPVLASIKLLLTYMANKLMDQDPWQSLETFPPPEPFAVTFTRMRQNVKRIFTKKSGDRSIAKVRPQKDKDHSGGQVNPKKGD
jgi:predicted PurR-regulated permease PerM